MKKLSLLIVLAVVVSLSTVSLTGCGPDPVTPKPADTSDTTDPGDPNNDPIVNGFLLGTTKYDIVASKATTFAEYDTKDTITYIYVTGNDLTKTPQTKQRAVITIKFKGNSVGKYTDVSDQARLDISTGSGIYQKDYSSTINGNCTINVSSYGSVGGKIKGTFSGAVKEGINEAQVKNGYFEVERGDNK